MPRERGFPTATLLLLLFYSLEAAGRRVAMGGKVSLLGSEHATMGYLKELAVILIILLSSAVSAITADYLLVIYLNSNSTNFVN